jgi:hypothetical protein
MLLPLRSGAPEIRCILDEGMLSAVRIPLISDHDRFVARLFRVQVDFKGSTFSDPDESLGITMTSDRRNLDAGPLRRAARAAALAPGKRKVQDEAAAAIVRAEAIEREVDQLHFRRRTPT